MNNLTQPSPSAPDPVVHDTSVDALADYLAQFRNIWVLTGAGISRGSGIPTYRDHDGKWQRSDPILHQEFISEPAARQRYWARSFVGWRMVDGALPNPAHLALARLEEYGLVCQVVTQNVDGLHQAAGSRRVLDLHGRLDRNICLDCGVLSSRAKYQETLAQANPHLEPAAAAYLPDGDADLGEEACRDVVIPPCPACGGMLKPDVVFFGGSVAPAVVSEAFDSLESADVVLLVGTSMQVYSGYRFCKRAAELDISITSVNLGVSRAEELISVNLRADCGTALPALADKLTATA